jgi:hypothetical protein
MSQIPTDLHNLIRPKHFQSQYFSNSAYGRLISVVPKLNKFACVFADFVK